MACYRGHLAFLVGWWPLEIGTDRERSAREKVSLNVEGQQAKQLRQPRHIRDTEKCLSAMLVICRPIHRSSFSLALRLCGLGMQSVVAR